MTGRRLLAITIFLAAGFAGYFQKNPERRLIRSGNGDFENGDYGGAFYLQ